MCYLITDENSAAKRHAYLIMAHSNPSQLCTLLKQIDDSRNDIFLHWDQKFPIPPQEEFFSVVKHSKLTFVPKPIAVYWGDYSLIQCELLLLQSATDKHEYDYYHLLSGQDLLIKSQEYIHDFFNSNAGKEFISVDSVADTKKYKFRIKYYFPFLRVKNLKSKPQKVMLLIWTMLQKLVGIDRTKGMQEEFRKGSNWFSITDKCARYILSKRAWIESVFENTFCCDELFLQMLLCNVKSSFEIYHNPKGDSSMREIDWKRGSPYTFRKEDFSELINSSAIFARKFDCNVDSEIIEMLAKHTL